MPPEPPALDIERSPLLRAILDDTVAQVWEFWGDGEYPSSRDLKDEADARVDEVLDTWSDEDLAAFAKSDSWVRVGLAEAGSVHPGDDRLQHVRRRLAMRIVEVGLRDAERELALRTLADPQPDARAFRTVPGLWEALSPRDLLLPLTPERVPAEPLSADPYLQFDGFGLFPNPYLRREREFFWELSELAREGRLEVKVAIDPFRVVPIDEVAMKLLEDYWFGARITRENLDSMDPRDLGRTFHRRDTSNPEGEINQTFYPLIGTSFDWSKRDETVKVLQVEEVRPKPSEPLADELVKGRYLHSERDTARHSFIHLDGAVKAFDAATYRPSETEPLAPSPKAPFYRKLFRVDGEITDEVWGMLVGHFFRGNELIAEYFGELVDERFPQT
jgi:hypothetical protein